MEWIKAFAPATVANIGPGFDILGMAVKGMGDIVEARKIPSGVKLSFSSEVKIISIDADYELSYNPEENTASIAALEVLRMIGAKGGVEIKLKKGLPCGSGLGSSAASAAAGAFAANYLYGNKLTKEELIYPATVAEGKVSGFHADNTGPALLGGANIITYSDRPQIASLGTISSLRIVLAIPNLVVMTKDARKILPKNIPIKSFVTNMGNSCLVAAAFAKNDYGLLARGLKDVVIEPVRKSLIKGFDRVRENAINAGADGMTISGSGPTVFAITNDAKKAEKIKGAMVDGFKESGVEAKGLVTEVDKEGTRLA